MTLHQHQHHHHGRGLRSRSWCFVVLPSLLVAVAVVNGQQERLFDTSPRSTTISNWEPPEYTSPPLQEAIEATPINYREDEVIQKARETDANHQCGSTTTTTTTTTNRCHIPFPSHTRDHPSHTKIGVVLYPGALVDPRSYSPLASLIRDRYGFSVVIPIFAHDLPFLATSPALIHNPLQYKCYSGRIELAQVEFPSVQQWILVGHSMGGVTAQSDMWQQQLLIQQNNQQNERTAKAGGLVLLSSYVVPDLPNPSSSSSSTTCQGSDFSTTNIPMAQLIGSRDRILHSDQLHTNKRYNSNATFFMEIFGSNHGSFGAYNTTGRDVALGGDAKQTESLPSQQSIIPRNIVWSLAADAIGHVASRLDNIRTISTTTTDDNRMDTTSWMEHKEEEVEEKEEEDVLESSSSRLKPAERRMTTLSWMFQYLVSLKR